MTHLAFGGRPRRLVSQVHRWSGLVLLAFLLLAGLTGSLLAFRGEVDARLNPQAFTVAAGEAPLPYAGIIADVEARYPGARVASITLPKSATESLRLSLKAAGEKGAVEFNQVFVDPYRGNVLAARNTSAAQFSRLNFVPFVLELHRRLFLDPWGGWWMGGCAVVWLLSSLMGLALSWPRGWTSPRAWRGLLEIRARQGSYKLNYDLHRATALASLPVLLVTAYTGIHLNLPEVVKPVVALFAPISAPARPAADKLQAGETAITVEAAIAVALAELPAGRVQSLTRDERKGFYALRVILADDVSPSGNNTVFVAMRDGAPLQVRRAAQGTAADTYLAWQLPLHAGYAFGTAGRSVVCLAGLVVAVMGVSGFNIWWRKRRGPARAAASRLQRA